MRYIRFFQVRSNYFYVQMIDITVGIPGHNPMDAFKKEAPFE